MSKIQEIIKAYNDQQKALFELIAPLTQDQMDWKLIIPMGDDCATGAAGFGAARAAQSQTVVPSRLHPGQVCS